MPRKRSPLRRPEPHRHIHDLVLGNTALLADLNAMPMAQIIDFLHEAGKRLVEVPATYETVTERMKVADSYRQGKRGRVYIGRAVDVRPLRGFVVGKDGKVDGAAVDLGGATADNTRLDDDVMCLVEIPAQYETLTRQVLKTPASVREEVVPAEYATVRRQVLDQEASTSSQDIPAQYQSVTRRVIDVEKLKAEGYKFDHKGNIGATPAGARGPPPPARPL